MSFVLKLRLPPSSLEWMRWSVSTVLTISGSKFWNKNSSWFCLNQWQIFPRYDQVCLIRCHKTCLPPIEHLPRHKFIGQNILKALMRYANNIDHLFHCQTHVIHHYVMKMSSRLCTVDELGVHALMRQPYHHAYPCWVNHFSSAILSHQDATFRPILKEIAAS